MDFAFSFWHAGCVRTISEETYVEKYRKLCKRYGYNFSQRKAKDLHIDSLGHFQVLPKNAITKMLIYEAIVALNSISRTAETFRTEIHRLAKLLPEYELSAYERYRDRFLSVGIISLCLSLEESCNNQVLFFR